MRTSVLGRAQFDDAAVSGWFERIHAALGELEGASRSAEALASMTKLPPTMTLSSVRGVSRRLEGVSTTLSRLAEHFAARKIAQLWKEKKRSVEEQEEDEDLPNVPGQRRRQQPAATEDASSTQMVILNEGGASNNVSSGNNKDKEKKKVAPRLGNASNKRGVLAARDANSRTALVAVAAPKKSAPVASRSTAKSRAAMEKVRARAREAPPGDCSPSKDEGWCGAGAKKQGWMETDEKIERKLQNKKRMEAGDEFARQRESTSSVTTPSKRGEETCVSTPQRAAAFGAAEAAAQRWLDQARRKPGGSTSRIAELESVVEALKVAKTTCSSSQVGDKPRRGNLTLAEARLRLRSAIERLLGGEASVELEVERWDAVVRGHPDFALEQERERQKWEDEQRDANSRALRVVRTVVPVDVHARPWTAATLQEAGVAPALASRVASSRALWLTRLPPAQIAKTHIAVFRAQCNTTGLDPVEQRAIYFALADVKFENDADGAKEAWKASIRDKLRTMVAKNQPSAPHWANLFEEDEEAEGPFAPDPPFLLADEDELANYDAVEEQANLRKKELEDLQNRGNLAANAVAIACAFGARRLPPPRKEQPARQQIAKDDPRAAMLMAIGLRAPNPQRDSDGGSSSSPPVVAAEAAVPDDDKGDIVDPRTSLLDMIKSRAANLASID